jgi:hypothetical protein
MLKDKTYKIHPALKGEEGDIYLYIGLQWGTDSYMSSGLQISDDYL